MNNVKIQRMSDLDKKYREEVAQVFVDAYYQNLTSLSKDKEKLVKAFKHAFVADVFFVATYENKIAGILACSYGDKRALHFDKRELKKYFGFIKGTIVYSIMKRQFHSPLQYGENTTYIESVATSTVARGKGIATALMNYVFDELPYQEYVLEVVDNNINAMRIYEKLGYREYERKKEKYPKLAGFEYHIYMKKCKEDSK